MTHPLRLEMSMLEAATLTDLVQQFTDLVTDAEDDRLADPAIARLVPDAYRDDPGAADEFRHLTQDDLLDRRRDEAAIVLATLQRDGTALRAADLDRADAQTDLVVELDEAAVTAWLRTLNSLRLVIATRLGVVDDSDHDSHDPRFGVYDWLGQRLYGLVRALED